MIDSGLLSGVQVTNDFGNLTERAIAFQVGAPITVMSPSYFNETEKLLSDLDITPPTTDSFNTFCLEAANSLPKMRILLQKISNAKAAPVNHFPHPLYRHIKDHLPVRLFETFRTLKARDGNSARNTSFNDFILEGCGFNTVTLNTSYGLILVGPLFIQRDRDDGVGQAYYRRFHEQISAFNNAIDLFWHRDTEIDPRGQRASLYAIDHLLRLAFSRQKLLIVAVEEKLAVIEYCLNYFRHTTLEFETDDVSPTFFSKMIATLASLRDGVRESTIKSKTFDGPSAPKETLFNVRQDGVTRVERALNDPIPNRFDLIYATNIERSFYNWSLFIAESLLQLRNWLTTSPIPTSQSAQITQSSSDFGRRLARFLVSIFNAFECTIYRQIYSDNRQRLVSFGAYSSAPHSEERLALMQAHMDSISGTPSQISSISFRCLIENRVQYCQYYDYGKMAAFPPGQTITYPKNTRFDFWGASACAIPIRVNGMFWGVLQLIGRRPHCFPEIVRAKIEEACGIISSHLFRTDLLHSIYNINRAIGRHDTSMPEKRASIEASLSRMFCSKTFAILRVDPIEQRKPVNVFLEAGRQDLRNASSRPDDHIGYFKPIIEFASGIEETWYAMIGSDEFKRRFGSILRRKFYDNSENDFLFLKKMRWELSDQASIPGVVMLTYPHEMDKQENWQETIEFVCQYISTITGSLYSSDLWERTLRDKIGHELSKTGVNLLSSVARLEEVKPPHLGAGTANNSIIITNVIGDLGRHAKSLDKYVKILTTHRDISDFDNDPRLYVIEQMRSRWRSDPARQPTQFRTVYNTAFFGQRERFEEQGIEIPRLDKSLNLIIDIDELCLNEVLATLVDNILKYTRKKTSVTVREASTERLLGIQVSNIGLRLEQQELHTIFDNEVRGARARALLPNSGSGYGLWFAQRAMHSWNCGLRHQQRSLPKEDENYAWQDFILGFRKSMIKE